ncbi:MAG: tRNA uridine 5-carboxymethylaminomethyl modification enzyme MnmG [Tenericutes bacterium ADurb.Bin239]|nr:MAG: tRNA uridine 5-carboxymethylaminomethyl modification enzyme MnmG [Tenericutes bacterium ADurb.Bin239]
MTYSYDLIVVGGGHAGIEAALASAHMGKKTLLLTLDIKKIANMPCNPNIGGSAKGIVVREIDALGGMMGIFADHDPLQIKILNTGKGPGVRCLRAQEDKIGYPRYVQSVVLNTPNLTVKEAMVVSLVHDDKKVYGVRLENGEEILAKITILTTGTYMESTILVGHTVKEIGPEGDRSSKGLSPYLAKMGLKIFRLKTGTPARLQRDSIDYSVMEEEPGMEGYLNFSYMSDRYHKLDEQVLCHLLYTTPKTHAIINKHLGDSAMYSGFVKGTGARYCPSIEDKIVRFSDKERHQLFIEPESRYTDSMYLQGLSTSMPVHVQEKMIRSLKGLENVVILKYGYAIEYDAIDPLELKPTLELKKWENLYCAGQIIGTSGYEEAAGLGLIAGINAVLKLDNKDPLILKRDEAYIGVMIDDLVTKGTEEPYRLLSSRSEYRLLLRHDNADARLTEIGRKVGLVKDDRWERYIKSQKAIAAAKAILESTQVGAKTPIVEYLESVGYPNYNGGLTVAELIKRPHVTLEDLLPLLSPLALEGLDYNDFFQLETDIKYEGYINKQRQEAKRLKKLEEVKIPTSITYENLDGLRIEARQRLAKVKPLTIGQAKRISGVNPNDIIILMTYLRRYSENEK